MPGVTPVNGANGAETNGAVAAPKFKVSATNNDVAASSSPVAPLTGLAVLKSLSANLDRYVNSLEDAEQARAALVDAAQGVVEALRPAPETVVGWFQTGSVVSAVHVFHHWRVFDTLPAEGTMTYAELAARVGADEVILSESSWPLSSLQSVQVADVTQQERLAWMLASTGVLRAVGTDRLAHTAVSRILVDDEAIGSMFKAMFNLVYDVSTVMPSYFDAYGPKEPAGPAHSPVSFFEGQPDKAFFEIISQDPARTHDFMRAMLTFGHVPTTGMYDAAWVVAEAAKGRAATPLVWVDVGGSNGHSLRLFLQENPGLPPERCVVQDLPAVVEEAGVKSRDDELLGRVQWAPLNFHSETPIKGQYTHTQALAARPVLYSSSKYPG